jgi:hypothetical protein
MGAPPHFGESSFPSRDSEKDLKTEKQMNSVKEKGLRTEILTRRGKVRRFLRHLVIGWLTD